MNICTFYVSVAEYLSPAPTENFVLCENVAQLAAKLKRMYVAWPKEVTAVDS